MKVPSVTHAPFLFHDPAACVLAFALYAMWALLVVFTSRWRAGATAAATSGRW